jgi:hypothetical protein
MKLEKKESGGYPCEAGMLITEVTQFFCEAMQFSFEVGRLPYWRSKFPLKIR